MEADAVENKEPTVAIGLRLPAALAREVERAAARELISTADVVRRAVLRDLQRHDGRSERKWTTQSKSNPPDSTYSSDAGLPEYLTALSRREGVGDAGNV